MAPVQSEHEGFCCLGSVEVVDQGHECLGGHASTSSFDVGQDGTKLSVISGWLSRYSAMPGHSGHSGFLAQAGQIQHARHSLQSQRRWLDPVHVTQG